MLRHRRNFDGFIVVMVLYVAFAVSAIASPQPAERRELKWRTGNIVLSVSNSLFNQRLTADENVQQAIRDSLSAWEGAADISIKTRDSLLQSVSPRGVKGDGTSLLTIASTPENLKLFPLQGNSPAATTRVFFNARGEITEADVVLNPYVQFSTDGAIGTYDLRTVLTHEVGHLLGLEHSPVWGARMFERTGKNVQTTGSTRNSSLTLSDLSAVRSLYGAKSDDVTCCSSVVVKATTSTSRNVKNGVAWIEEAATGRVAAAAIASEGLFRIGGIADGKYRAFVQYGLASGKMATGWSEVSVEMGDDASVEFEIPASAAVDLPVSFIGLNAQLAQLPLTLIAGQTQRIWAGGSGIGADGPKPRFFTDLLSANPESFRSTEYGSNLKALSFEIRASSEAPPGQYTLPFESLTGGRSYLIGAISVAAN